MSKKLPDKPSELLLVALADLEAVEQDKRYVVNMRVWHEANGQCAVCLAGSVMAKTLNVSPVDSVIPDVFDVDAYDKLLTLDDFRCGSLDYGLRRLGLPETGIDNIDSLDEWGADYDGNREEWWNAMLGIVGILQAEGL
jgi:hypothetical protein